MKRAETGPMRFGEDWPGIFIRGDNAFYYATIVNRILSYDGEIAAIFDSLTVAGLMDLRDLLLSSDASLNNEKQMMLDFDKCEKK